MARVCTRIGNVFSVKLGEASRRNLQDIMDNLATQLYRSEREMYENELRSYQEPSEQEEVSKKYFQYIANDLTQLNSSVIRAFKKVYHIDETPNLSEVVKGEVDFYVHCVLQWGLKMGLWEKVGNVADVGDIEQVLFRDTDDFGTKPGEEPVKVSHNWHVWRINDPDFTHVGKLEGENRRADIGIVISPSGIVHRMRTGKYDFVYPE